VNSRMHGSEGAGTQQCVPATRRIMGAGNRSAIGTLVERHTRFLLLIHVPVDQPTAQAIRDGICSAMADLPLHLRRSLTWDQGKEMALHRQVTAAVGTAVYFCDAHSPWQRGSNENTVSVGVPRLGCSDRLIPAVRGDSREYWPPFGCALRLTCPSSCRHRPGPLVLA